MNLRVFFYMTFIIIAFTSCSNSSLLMDSETKDGLKPIDLSLLEGRYWNHSKDSINPECIWGLINPFYSSESNFFCFSEEEKYVELTIDGKNLIKLKLFKGDTLIEKKQLRFRVDDNIIVVSGFENSSIQGIPLVFYRNTSINLNIGLNYNNDLVISYKGSALGGLVLIIFGTPITGEGVFKRIE